MLKPIIKYTGGKYNEYKKIQQYFPDSFKNYYEPFFGGGGVFFRLYNENKLKHEKHISDFSDSLIELYRSVPTETLKSELTNIANSWAWLREFSEWFFYLGKERFLRLLYHDKDEVFVNEYIRQWIRNEINEHFELNTHGFSLEERIVSSLNDKLDRFRKKDLLDEEDVSYTCITTSICQAFYFIIRDMYNDWNNHGNKDKYTSGERCAQWMFIREFCFCSMFRFGPNGDFNVPYGGFSYNKKSFYDKIENATSEEAKQLFATTDIQCGDFEDVIKNWNMTEDDFMFLDPPYDSTFSEYDDKKFNQEDHKRLAETLKNCKCKWLMAIGKTDFIYNLYKDCYMVEYDKTYAYQARGEYDNKHTTHLVITNYPIDNQGAVPKDNFTI